ncbi:MAG TPA: inositol monophosphatase family protein, partial [Polyangiaceae bacterium]|nr:inositol monophosphatase family protein [Polyangiaceae bacterium]
MPRSELTPESYASLALEVAAEAGTLLLTGYRKRPTPTEKARRDLVTEFDLESEALIVARLSAATPELGLVAEEGGGLQKPLSWFCDPLDGTTNFVHGHPFWAVSIGLLDHGRPVAGAVVAPALGLTWLGFQGGAAQRSGEICHVSETSDLEQALVATGFPPDRHSAPANNLDTFVRVKQVVRGVRRCGSAAIDMCLVADGTYDAYWERRLNTWDLAAGAAVVLAAGGKLTALDGGTVDLSIGHLIASNGRVHAALEQL